MKPPVPGSRSREWLQQARSGFEVAVNPLPDANLTPGRRPEPRKRLGMERELAKKWED